MSETSADERASIRQAIERRGIDFVGQEAVKLSTTPVWVNGRLEPHPFTVRVFVAATSEGYKVMPGGFAVIGDKNDPRAVTMQKGARSADVWVLSNGHANQTTLLPTLALDTNQWLALAVVPIAVSVVAMVTAHLTVIFVLGRDL